MTELKLINNTEVSLEALENRKPSDILPYFQPNGLDALIEKIAKEAGSFKGDISTEKGRKEIASYAYKLAKAKTTIEKLGKESIAELKSSVQAVDKERIRAVNEIQKIQDAVRQPLTDWENKEKERVDTHNNLLAEISRKSGQIVLLSIEEMEAYIVEISSDNRDWQEFTERAKDAKTAAIEATNKAIESCKQYEAEQAELAKFRQEEAERKQKEHEENITKKAKEEAEAIAKAAFEAEQRKQEAELKRIEQEKIEMAKQAEVDKQKAIQQEKDRQEAERKKEADELANREADKKHKASIHNDILACLNEKNINESDAKIIITAIAKGEINHVKILY